MSQTYNIYCDESCHLENDGHGVMVLGAVWCPLEKRYEIATRLREIKVDHGLKPEFEMKWTKVSPAQVRFYRSIINFFFDDDDLHFRAVVIPDKKLLDHQIFGQSHDEWYYKMYFEMLRVILSPHEKYRIYLDYKDTHGATRVRKLDQVLRNSLYDFSREILERTQIVRSDESELLQLTDLMIGAVSYANRSLTTSQAKLSLIERIRERSGYSLKRTTLFRENKVNIFCWQPTERQG